MNQNAHFDEVYNNYVFPDTTIIAIEPEHKPKIHIIPEPYKGAFKSDDYLESWLQQVEVYSVEKKDALASMISDYRAAGLIDEYLTTDFVEYFYDVQEEVPLIDNIAASGFITTYFIANCSGHIELIHYLFHQPWDFEKMFTTYFLPILMKAGINDIHVVQKTQKDETYNRYLYNLQISSTETTLQIVTYGNGDVFAPFVLAINKLLLNKATKERFVRSIDTGDIAFLFIEPAKTVEIAHKYNLRFVAVKL